MIAKHVVAGLFYYAPRPSPALRPLKARRHPSTLFCCAYTVKKSIRLKKAWAHTQKDPPAHPLLAELQVMMKL